MDEPKDGGQLAFVNGESAPDWDAVDRDAIEAVVLDTNAFSGGEFSRPTLEAWAREARAAHIEIWLPEVVVWELASHAAERREAARQGVELSRKALQAAGIEPPDFPAMTREEVLEIVTAEISQVDGVTILKCSAEHAMEGLKDQVLGRDPVEVKKGVKTGAADGAWLRSALDVAADLEGTIILVSSDRLTLARIDKWGMGEPMVVRSWADIRDGIFKYKSAAADATRRVLHFLSSSVAAGNKEERIELGSVKAGKLPDDLLEHWGWDDVRQLDVGVTGLTLVLGVGDLQVDVEESTATADVYFQGDVSFTGWMDDPEEGLVPSIENLNDAVISVPMILALHDDKVLASNGDSVLWANAEQSATAFFPIPRYWEDDDAIADILASLRLVPGIGEQRDDWSVFHTELEANEVALDLGNGRVAELSLEWSRGDYWRLSVFVGDDSLDLVCEFDLDVFVGGIPFDPPWRVSVKGAEGTYSRTPDWALSAFLIRCIVGA